MNTTEEQALDLEVTSTDSITYQVRVRVGEDAMHFTAHRDCVLWAVVEVMLLYDTNIKASQWPQDLHFSPNTHGRLVRLGMNEPGRIGAIVHNGDDGRDLITYGHSVLEAIATLAKEIGFKSELRTTGTVTLPKYLQDFEYGLQRASDERLALELEAITAPQKGAW